MAAEYLWVFVSEGEDQLVVSLVGELDVGSVQVLTEACADLPAGDVVLDLVDLAFVDAAGLAALLAVRRSVIDRGYRCNLVHAVGLVRRVFGILELDDLLSPHDSADTTGD